MEPVFVPKRRPGAAPKNGGNGNGNGNGSRNGGSSNGGSKGSGYAGSSEASGGGVASSGGAEAAAEDDGWLLCTVYDAERGQGTLCIFDAAAVAAGPVARIRLPHHLPSGLHGSWSFDFFGDGDGGGGGGAVSAAPKWRDPNRIRPL